MHVVTITDVARAAHVSRMTVSRVLNGAVNVASATRDAVLESVRSLGYVPNLPARCLVAGRNLHVALVYAAGAIELAPVLLAAVPIAERNHVRLVPMQIKVNPGSAGLRTALRSLQGAAGAIVLPFDGSDRVRLQLERASTPVVAVGARDSAAEHACVCTDEFAAAGEMTKLLLSLGHRRVAFIDGDSAPGFPSARCPGFEAAVRDCHHRFESAMTVHADRSYRGGMQAAARVLASGASVTAIFASHDEIAAGASAVAQRLGWRVPQDLSIVGFGDSSIATRTSPELTTVRIPVAAMAARAMELIMSAMCQGTIGEVAVPLVPHEIVRRGSLAPAPIARGSRRLRSARQRRITIHA